MPRNLSPSDVAHFRDRLCDVATQMLAEVGSEGFNMRELAARMGVSAMTTYRYFKDKNEILLAVRKRAFRRFADRLEAAISACVTRDEKLEALGLAYARFAREERVHYALMFDLSVPQPASDMQPEELHARAVMAVSLRGDETRFESDTELGGTILWAALHGVVTLNLTGKLSDAEFSRALSETVRAIGAAPAPQFPMRSPAADVGLPAGAQPEPSYNHVHAIALSPAE